MAKPKLTGDPLTQKQYEAGYLKGLRAKYPTEPTDRLRACMGHVRNAWWATVEAAARDGHVFSRQFLNGLQSFERTTLQKYHRESLPVPYVFPEFRKTAAS